MTKLHQFPREKRKWLQTPSVHPDYRLVFQETSKITKASPLINVILLPFRLFTLGQTWDYFVGPSFHSLKIHLHHYFFSFVLYFKLFSSTCIILTFLHKGLFLENGNKLAWTWHWKLQLRVHPDLISSGLIDVFTQFMLWINSERSIKVRRFSSEEYFSSNWHSVKSGFRM